LIFLTYRNLGASLHLKENKRFTFVFGLSAMVISEDTYGQANEFEVVSRREVPKTLQLVPTIRLKKRVLVVDDEPVIADTLATMLRKAGYLATAAYLGTEALNFARQHPPDLLITDLAMRNGRDRPRHQDQRTDSRVSYPLFFGSCLPG